MKEFKVVSVSINTNSFGLYGVVMVARDGEAYQVAMSQLNKPERGAILNVPVTASGKTDIGRMGEIPQSMQRPNKATIKAMWQIPEPVKSTI